ncbi:PleD family two-component system response regulator [Mucilaginibacter ximonensis]|uniref:PleD family two-component system response regulator n=1 Tax=Mucilaginibacter ximonensis TaxID=538021 RepID=A0ABW5YAK9_9SPHI
MKKVLLLDDELDILYCVEHFLSLEKFEVKSTVTCHNFINIAEQFRPDIAILDYRLADGDGGEICRMMKAHPTLKHVPVIIFTAYVKRGLNFFDFGCDEVIIKPFDLENLLSTINRLTGIRPINESQLHFIDKAGRALL